MTRQSHSAPPLGWGRQTTALPGERERLVQCARCGAIADAQTYFRRDGRERIKRTSLAVVPIHGKLGHRGCRGKLRLIDIGDCS